MADTFVYLVDLPDGVHEMVAPCDGGYTVYLSAKDTRERQIKSYLHAVGHVARNDHEKSDVSEIEGNAHKEGNDDRKT